MSQSRRFQPGLRQLRALVGEGSLGRPQTLSATLHTASRFGGFRHERRYVMLRDMAIHAFDGARAILDADAVSVRCTERSPEGSRFRHRAEAHALFEMSDGSLFSFHGSWSEAGPPTRWNGERRVTLSHGAARWNGERPARAWREAPEDAPGFLPEALPVDLSPAPEAMTDALGSLESLLRAIRAGAAPETRVRSNARSLAMVFAAVRSAEAGGRREPVRDLGLMGDASRARPPRRRSGGNG